MSNRNQNAAAIPNSNRIQKINSLTIDQINMDGSRARLNNSPDVAGDFGLQSEAMNSDIGGTINQFGGGQNEVGHNSMNNETVVEINNNYHLGKYKS